MAKKLPLWGRREKRVGFFSLSPNWKVVWETEVAGRRKRERGRRNISPGSAKNAFSSFPSVSEAFFSQPLIFGVGKAEAEILITPDKLLPWNKILYLFSDPLWAFYLQQSAEKVVRYWLATFLAFSKAFSPRQTMQGFICTPPIQFPWHETIRVNNYLNLFSRDDLRTFFSHLLIALSFIDGFYLLFSFVEAFRR